MNRWKLMKNENKNYVIHRADQIVLFSYIGSLKNRSNGSISELI